MSVVSTHVLSASINGMELSVISGSITVDEDWIPYVQASLECWSPSSAQLETIDPRAGLRVLLTATSTWDPRNPRASITRTFDLGLRSRSSVSAEGVITLDLASDEALLQDRALVSAAPERIFGLSAKAAALFALGKIGANLSKPQRTNRILNPSFEAVGGSTVIRTNLFLNPNSVGGAEGASVPYWTGVVRTGGYPVTSGTGTYTAAVAAATGTVVGGRVRLMSPTGGDFTVQARETKAGLFGSQPTMQSTVVSLVTGVPQEVAVGGTVTGVDSDGWRINMTGPNGVHVLGAQMESGTPAPSAIFAGSDPATGDFTYAWTGTANASTSTQTALGAANSTRGTTNAFVIRSSEWATRAGEKSARIIPLSTGTGSNNTFVFTHPTGNGLGSVFIAGKTYTASATVRLSAPQTGGLSTYARSIMFNGAVTGITQAAAPNTAGTHRVTITFTVAANETSCGLRLYNGASLLGGDVWWDDVLVVEGTSAGEYFDGASVASGLTYAWTGTPHASTSYEAYAPADANVTANEAEPTLTNLIPNPSAEVNVTDWTAVVNASIARTTTQAWLGTASAMGTTPAAGDAAWFVSNVSTYLPATQGLTYTFSVYVRSSVARGVKLSLRFYNSSNAAVGSDKVGDEVVTSTTGWTRLTVQASAPLGATRVGPIITVVASGAGNVHYFDGAMLVASSDDLPYFDGATSIPGLYTHAWTGTANNSTSTKTWIPNADIMVLEPGVSLWDYVEPIVRAAGLRLYCDETRTWRLVPPLAIAEGQLTIAASQNLTRGSDTISLDDDLWYDAVVIRYLWEDGAGIRQSAYDTAGAPGTKVRFLTIERPYPGAGLAGQLLAQATGRGRVLDLASTIDLTAMPGQPLAATLPGTIAQTGFVSAVSWSWPDGEMSVTSRGLVDTPLTAWILAPVGRRWDDIALGIDWTEYTP